MEETKAKPPVVNGKNIGKTFGKKPQIEQTALELATKSRHIVLPTSARII